MVRGLIAIVLAGGTASAAPPAPPIYPAEFPEELGGYSLPSIYQLYHLWVGRGREPALRQAIRHEQDWRGKHHWGSIAFSKVAHYDFGVIRMDLLDRYCSGDALRDEPPGDCEHRYRYAFVPGSLYSDELREKLIRQSFRPTELTDLLRRESWSHPGSNGIWSDSRLTQIFERHTDLALLYQPHVEVHDIAEAECPVLKLRLNEFNQLALTLDPENQGKLSVPPPHGQQTEISLMATTPGGGRVTIEGAEPLYGLMKPVWAAAEACSPPSYKKERAG